jgi:hypothetical protein
MSVERVNLALELSKPAECAAAKAHGHSRPLLIPDLAAQLKPTTQPSALTARQRGDR